MVLDSSWLLFCNIFLQLQPKDISVSVLEADVATSAIKQTIGIDCLGLSAHCSTYKAQVPLGTQQIGIISGDLNKSEYPIHKLQITNLKDHSSFHHAEDERQKISNYKFRSTNFKLQITNLLLDLT